MLFPPVNMLNPMAESLSISSLGFFLTGSVSSPVNINIPLKIDIVVKLKIDIVVIL